MGVYASHLHAGYPTRATLEHPESPSWLTPTGLSPSMVRHSSRLRVHHLGVPGSKHHIPPAFRQEVRFALCRFRSPLLTASLLLSFPAGTKMFQFPAFPIPMGSLRVYRSRKSHSGIPGSKAPCAYPGLIAAWHALPRRPSLAIHQTACSSSLSESCSGD